MSSQDSALTANIEGVPCGGKGATLYVVNNENPCLAAVSVRGQRVRWRDGAYPYTAFLRNCNLTKTSRCCKGMLCVFRRSSGDVHFRLGVVGNLSPMWNDKVLVYEWTGVCTMELGVYTPTFLLEGKSFPVNFEKVSSHFTPVALSLDLDGDLPELFFVNMVSSHPEMKLQRECSNPTDGCFEMSPVGPDQAVVADSLPGVQNESWPLRVEGETLESTNKNFRWNRFLKKDCHPRCLGENGRSIDHHACVFHVISLFDDRRDVMSLKDRIQPKLPKETNDAITDLLAVPFVRRGSSDCSLDLASYLDKKSQITFAFVERAVWRRMVSMGSMSIADHNEYLRKHKRWEMSLEVLSLNRKSPGGLRVAIATKMETVNAAHNSVAWEKHRERDDCVVNHSFTGGNERGVGSVVIRYAYQREVRRKCA